jgi:hypothetical protein
VEKCGPFSYFPVCISPEKCYFLIISCSLFLLIFTGFYHLSLFSSSEWLPFMSPCQYNFHAMHPVVYIDLGGFMPTHNRLILLHIISDWIEYINRSVRLFSRCTYAGIIWLLHFAPEDVGSKFLKNIHLEDYMVSQSRRLQSECCDGRSNEGKVSFY